MSRLSDAIAVRDAALRLLTTRGTWCKHSDGLRSLDARLGSLTIAHRSPFQKLPAVPERLKYLGALIKTPRPDNLANGLDIWEDGQGKVLNIEWDNERVLIVSFRRGAWERRLGAEASCTAG